MINGENSDLESSYKRILKRQILSALFIVVLIAGVLLLKPVITVSELPLTIEYWGSKLGASLYGCGLAIAGTILTVRSARRATKGVAIEATKDMSESVASLVQLSMLPVYWGLLNKLVIVGGGIGFGLVYLKLPPIEMLTSYLVVQFVNLWTAMIPQISDVK